MKRTSRTIVNWTKLILAFALLCSVFGFSITAQTNDAQPLTDTARAALVEELKEVVAKSTPDEKDAALVAERWDKRTDLKGKTKKEVINLLFEDVKAVIKDSGIHYQIYSIFSFYKQIPDESFSAQTQETDGANSNLASVNKLVELTFQMHPYVRIDELIASLPGTQAIKDEEERVRKVRLEVFDEALQVNNKLTPGQKSFVKANYDRLSNIIDKIIDDTIKTNFPTEKWIKEGLQESYRAKFSEKELAELIAYFQGAAGQQVLKRIRISNLAELITGNGGTLAYTKEDKAEYDKFASTPLGKKFITAYITDAEAYEQHKVDAVLAENSNADGFAILEPSNLNQFFNKFVSENYRT